MWCLTWLEDLDDVHRAAAAGAGSGKGSVNGVGGGLRLGHSQQFAGPGQIARLGAAGQEAVVTDAVQAGGQDVDQQAEDELVRLQRHGGIASVALDAIVLDLEGHPPPLPP